MTCYLTLLGLILNQSHPRKILKRYQAYFYHAPSPGHRPAYPLPLSASTAQLGNDHRSHGPRWPALRLPLANKWWRLTGSRCVSVSQWRASCPPRPAAIAAKYNRIALPGICQPSLEQVRARCLMYTLSSNSAGQRYCKPPSDRLFSYPWMSGMGLKGLRSVAFGAPRDNPKEGSTDPCTDGIFRIIHRRDDPARVGRSDIGQRSENHYYPSTLGRFSS